MRFNKFMSFGVQDEKEGNGFTGNRVGNDPGFRV